MSKPRVVAFIQARQTSTRLPNKVLAKIGRWNSLELMERRLKRSDTLDDIVFLIPDTPANDELAKFVEEKLLPKYFRGDENDVLRRFALAAELYPADYYVRLTADCPFICPELVDQVVNTVIEQKAAYGSNTNPPTFPDGFDAECMTREALFWAHENVSNSSWREHVTLGIRDSDKKPKNWKFVNVSRPGASRAWIRLTLDCPEDLTALRQIADEAGDEILTWGMVPLESSYIAKNLEKINGQIVRNSGLTQK